MVWALPHDDFVIPDYYGAVMKCQVKSDVRALVCARDQDLDRLLRTAAATLSAYSNGSGGDVLGIARDLIDDLVQRPDTVVAIF